MLLFTLHIQWQSFEIQLLLYTRFNAKFYLNAICIPFVGHNNINVYLVIGWHSCCVAVADWTTVILYTMSTGNIGGKYIAVCCTDCLGISYLL